MANVSTKKINKQATNGHHRDPAATYGKKTPEILFRATFAELRAHTRSALI